VQRPCNARATPVQRPCNPVQPRAPSRSVALRRPRWPLPAGGVARATAIGLVYHGSGGCQGTARGGGVSPPAATGAARALSPQERSRWRRQAGQGAKRRRPQRAEHHHRRPVALQVSELVTVDVVDRRYSAISTAFSASPTRISPESSLGNSASRIAARLCDCKM